eukprot:TRINITY_DN28009_c0_g1_i1.p1 TRINITY_DN28009_c0_g1~~TRINITY_DN28009_c0_g1_i1.p1  ORF type:complete len:795 (+),score=73.75 TRINITY_DN28009_c0_g1_i1:52-2385(+)
MEKSVVHYAATFPLEVNGAWKWTRMSVSDLVPIAVNDLKVGELHEGRVLFCTVASECIRFASLMMQVRDSQGDVVNLAIYNNVDDAAVFQDRWMAIANPLYKIRADGTLGIRIDAPNAHLGFDPEPFTYSPDSLVAAGATVVSHSLSTTALNRIIGPVHELKADRVLVDLPPHGKKLLKPANLSVLKLEPATSKSPASASSGAEIEASPFSDGTKLIRSIDAFTGLSQQSFLTSEGTILPDVVSMARNMMHFMGGPSFDLKPGQPPPPEFFETMNKMQSQLSQPRSEKKDDVVPTPENTGQSTLNIGEVYGEPKAASSARVEETLEAGKVGEHFGQHVIICGLKSRPELNGRFGWSLGLTDNGRVGIMFNCAEPPVAIRHANLAALRTSTGLFYAGSFGEKSYHAYDLCRQIMGQISGPFSARRTLHWRARFMEGPLMQLKAIFVNQAAAWRDPVRSAILIESIWKAMKLGCCRSFVHEDSIDAARKALEQLQAEFWLVAIWSKLLGQAPKVSIVRPIAIEYRAIITAGAGQADVIQDCIHQEPPAVHDPGFEEDHAHEVWAQSIENRIAAGNIGASPTSAREDDSSEDVHLLQFARYPEQWREALLEGISLKSCRDALEEAGYTCVLPSGCKVFVHPWQYLDVMAALSRMGDTLRPYHVVVSASLEHLVEECLARIPRQLKVKVRARDLMNLRAEQQEGLDSGDRHSEPAAPSYQNVANGSWEQTAQSELSLYEVKRTFLCRYCPVRSSSSVVQSTTEAHGGFNPRRHVIPDEAIA